MRRLFGGVMSNSTEKDWPQLAQEMNDAEISMPSEALATNRVTEMGPVSRFLHPDAYAVTSPFGTIAFNRALIEKDKQNLGDVVTHELTHIGQGKSAFLKKYVPGGLDKLEQEAVNREAMRPVRRNDVYLRPKIQTGPSSSSLKKKEK